MRTLINSFRQAQESNIQDAFEQLVLVGIFCFAVLASVGDIIT